MKQKSKKWIDQISTFISTTKGLKLSWDNENTVSIFQNVDGKHLTFKYTDIEEVLQRKDSKSESFIQINFFGDKKIILTDRFIGFKPFKIQNLDMTKLPKVVTTPDLLNFIEIIEDSMYEIDVTASEIRDIRKYFESVLLGAEKVGFDLVCERVWIERLFHNHPALVSQVS
ncbi:MAG: hypothetical protein OXK80_01900 [Bdellovibrionales bacterium]|nr:hypothetical protein [Bdellovibrionales bacterium]